MGHTERLKDGSPQTAVILGIGWVRTTENHELKTTAWKQYLLKDRAILCNPVVVEVQLVCFVSLYAQGQKSEVNAIIRVGLSVFPPVNGSGIIYITRQ